MMGMAEDMDSSAGQARDNVSDKKGMRLLKGFQLAELFGFFVMGLLLTGLAGAVVSAIPGLPERGRLLLTSTLQCVFAFCIPAWLMARFSVRHPAEWLCIKTKPSVRQLLGVIVVYVLAMPAMNWIIAWNEGIHLPESLSGLENAMRASEEAAGAISAKILTGMDVGWMLAAVLVVGLLTGFSEELFFRSGLQTIFMTPGRTALAVCGAAAVFSAIHFQFFGFVPRLLMGAFFGYLLVWTRSLWVPAFAHALNNSIVVIGAWTSTPDGFFSDMELLGTPSAGKFPWAAVASVMATALFLIRFRIYFFRHPGKY